MALAINHALICLHQQSARDLKNEQSCRQLSEDHDLRPSLLANTPDPSLFDSSSEDSKLIHTRSPTLFECASHLELLHAFHRLKSTVTNSTKLDKALEIFPQPRTVYRDVRRGRWGPRRRVAKKLRDNTFETRRKVKWPLYLAVATIRFLRWSEILRLQEDVPPSGEPFTLSHLPPIDILMVCHALCLNPVWLNSSEKPSFLHLKQLIFPWHKIHEAISSDTPEWTFSLSEEESNGFMQTTGLDPDLFEGLLHNGRPEGLNDMDVDGYRSFARPSEFALTGELIKAVTRQSLFVDKMEKHLWLRSPCAKDTLYRSIDRYDRFVQLLRHYPNTLLVPKLDIDLVWHTHQCSPPRYRQAMVERAGRMIDHNDKLGPSTLEPGMDKTRDLFRIRFGGEYDRCLCWDCEALLSAFTESPDNDSEAKVKEVMRKVALYRRLELERRISVE